MSQLYPRAEITLDQSVALKTAASRLSRDFTGTFNEQTIDRFLHSSYEQFADTATITRFLPLLAERFARQRLQALARVEGSTQDGKPVVLFLCTHNAGRSQMALGFFQHYAVTRLSRGPAAPNPVARSMPPRSRSCASAASTSRPSTRSRGPTRSSRQLTW